jgi:cytoskeletal protein RodZ
MLIVAIVAAGALIWRHRFQSASVEESSSPVQDAQGVVEDASTVNKEVEGMASVEDQSGDVNSEEISPASEPDNHELDEGENSDREEPSEAASSD